MAVPGDTKSVDIDALVHMYGSLSIHEPHRWAKVLQSGIGIFQKVPSCDYAVGPRMKSDGTLVGDAMCIETSHFFMHADDIQTEFFSTLYDSYQNAGKEYLLELTGCTKLWKDRIDVILDHYLVLQSFCHMMDQSIAHVESFLSEEYHSLQRKVFDTPAVLASEGWCSGLSYLKEYTDLSWLTHLRAYETKQEKALDALRHTVPFLFQ